LVTVSDDAKHGVTAVKRSSRVVSTLFININECVCSQLLCISLLINYCVKLPKNPQTHRRTRLRRYPESLPLAMRQTHPNNPREKWLNLYKTRPTSQQHELPPSERVVRHLHPSTRQVPNFLL
jgi:hypothetical protein